MGVVCEDLESRFVLLVLNSTVFEVPVGLSQCTKGLFQMLSEFNDYSAVSGAFQIVNMDADYQHQFPVSNQDVDLLVCTNVLQVKCAQKLSKAKPPQSWRVAQAIAWL